MWMNWSNWNPSQLPCPRVKNRVIRCSPMCALARSPGLLELLEHRKEDLYRIAQELQLELDDILPIVEAAQMMELVELKEETSA